MFTKRTRNIGFEDYGIDRDMAVWLQKLCRIDLPEVKAMVEKAAMISNPGLAKYISKSLIEELSYHEMETSDMPVPASQPDFYGYRRKALSIFSTLYLQYLLYGEANK